MHIGVGVRVEGIILRHKYTLWWYEASERDGLPTAPLGSTPTNPQTPTTSLSPQTPPLLPLQEPLPVVQDTEVWDCGGKYDGILCTYRGGLLP